MSSTSRSAKGAHQPNTCVVSSSNSASKRILELDASRPSASLDPSATPEPDAHILTVSSTLGDLPLQHDEHPGTNSRPDSTFTQKMRDGTQAVVHTTERKSNGRDTKIQTDAECRFHRVREEHLCSRILVREIRARKCPFGPSPLCKKNWDPRVSAMHPRAH